MAQNMSDCNSSYCYFFDTHVPFPSSLFSPSCLLSPSPLPLYLHSPPTHSSSLPPYVFSCFPPTHTPSLLFQGTLRVLLVLLHDFPEFLCDYHFSFCDVIPPNCIQMRNLILSAFPRNMRLPDPFTPNLKVTRPLKFIVRPEGDTPSKVYSQTSR